MVPPRLAGSYLVLETTNQCSLACVHCTVAEGTAHPHHSAVGFMAEELVHRVLDDLARSGAQFDTLIPFWLGEPLIHPAFGAVYQACLRAAADHGTFRRLELHTNATHLGRDRVRVALNAAPVRQTWHFSLDATTADRYRTIKGKGLFEEVEANLLGFLDELARTKAPWPRPVFQMIVGENNADQVPEFAARWGEACRKRGIAVSSAAQTVPDGADAVVFFRQLDAPTPELQERANAAYRAAMAGIGLRLPLPGATPTSLGAGSAGASGPGVCGCFWKSPVVSWDGRVTTCTRDNRFENVLGNVNDTPLTELWWGARMRTARAGVAGGRYDGFAACAGCFIPRSANYADIRTDEIAAWG